MTKIDWSKGGFHEPDPARVQRDHDFLEPDPLILKGKQPPRSNSWAEAIKARRLLDRRTQGGGLVRGVFLTQQEVLMALGISKRKMNSKSRGEVLKQLVAEGVLLHTGQPNPSNPRVKKIASRKPRARTKKS
jgi:hypothetical protein